MTIRSGRVVLDEATLNAEVRNGSTALADDPLGVARVNAEVSAPVGFVTEVDERRTAR